MRYVGLEMHVLLRTGPLRDDPRRPSRIAHSRVLRVGGHDLVFSCDVRKGERGSVELWGS